MSKTILFFAGLVLMITTEGCTRHEVEIKPVEVKPIHITIDVNVKVDRALDNFFGDIDKEATGESAEGNKEKTKK